MEERFDFGFSLLLSGTSAQNRDLAPVLIWVCLGQVHLEQSSVQGKGLLFPGHELPGLIYKKERCQ